MKHYCDQCARTWEDLVPLCGEMVCPACCIAEMLVQLRKLRASIDEEAFVALEMTIALAEFTQHQPEHSQMLCARALVEILLSQDVAGKLRDCAETAALIMVGGDLVDHLLGRLSG